MNRKVILSIYIILVTSLLITSIYGLYANTLKDSQESAKNLGSPTTTPTTTNQIPSPSPTLSPLRPSSNSIIIESEFDDAVSPFGWTGADPPVSVSDSYLHAKLYKGQRTGWSGVYYKLEKINTVYLYATECTLTNLPDKNSSTQAVLAFTVNQADSSIAAAGIMNVEGTLKYFMRYFDNDFEGLKVIVGPEYTPGSHTFELGLHQDVIEKGTGDQIRDGWVKFYVDGNVVLNVSNVNNYGRILNYARLGFCYADSPSNRESIFTCHYAAISNSFV